ncbi:MAG: transcription termination/antitermination protein NusA [Chloroflexi bacterium]|nr:transcription termination/antitermination protein NusA [Chloroflexota bacterium]
MKSDFLIAVTQLAAERNLPKEVVLSAIEAALVSAYKKDSQGTSQEIAVKIMPNTGEVRIFTLKTAVEKPEDSQKEISLAEARKFKKDAAVGDVIEFETTAQYGGRIAAQTAKQVVIQRLREAERELVFAEYSQKEGDILSGVIQRVEPKQITVDLGRTEAVLPASEQVPTERYRAGQRLKFFILEVSRTNKGPQVVVSRTHRNLLRRLFEMEVPEIFNGIVELKAIAREPGYRSKVAVFARQDGVDAVGSCVGMRGMRIQNIVNELQGEKIDVVQWHSDPASFIANSLSPAQVLKVEVSNNEKTATVVVPDKQLSLAIGKEGQNARLAAKLTGWRIDIKNATEAEEAEKARKAALEAEKAAAAVLTPEEAPPAVEEAAPVPPPPPLEEEAVPAELVLEEEVEMEPVAPAPEEVEEGETRAEEVWAIPTAPLEKPQLRFAEEIQTLRPQKSSSKAKKGKKSTREGQREIPKGKKGRKQAIPSIEEKDYEEYLT